MEYRNLFLYMVNVTEESSTCIFSYQSMTPRYLTENWLWEDLYKGRWRFSEKHNIQMYTVNL